MSKTVKCYLTGICPRPDDLVEITRMYDRGLVKDNLLMEKFEEATDEIIKTQIEADLDYIVDGMLRWQDLLRPFLESLSGVEINGLSRWYNNNTFYRKPIIRGKIEWKEDQVLKVSYIEKLPRNKPWKIILPGVYTLAKLSEDKYYHRFEPLVFDYALALKNELDILSKTGFEYVQFSEPSLVYRPMEESPSREELEIIKNAYQTLTKNCSLRTCIHTFFGDLTSILPDLLDFPVDDIGFDLYEVNLEELLEYRTNKGIAVGAIDSRSSLIENPREIADLVIRVTDALQCRYVFICPNCDLEYLPWKRAKEKIRVLANVKTLLKGE